MRDSVGVEKLKFESEITKNPLFSEIGYFDIKVQGIDNRMRKVAATTFHPNNTNFFWSIVNTLYEFFWGPKVIKVLSKNHLAPLYVQVDELATALAVLRSVIKFPLLNCEY